MFSSRDVLPPGRQPCYFSITPGRGTTSPPETPLSPLSSPQHIEFVSADPSNPLLAVSAALPITSKAPSMASQGRSMFQIQMQAAHQPDRKRPQAQPVQDDFLLSSGLGASSYAASDKSASSSTSSCSSTGNSPGASPLAARCSRCQRTAGLDLTTQKSNMVAYGLNLHYCMRCADIVGFRRRS